MFFPCILQYANEVLVLGVWWSGGVVLGCFWVGRDLGGMGREKRTQCSWSGVVLGVWVVGRGGFGWFLGR